MPRLLTYVPCCVGCILFLASAGNAADKASRPSETLLPNTTQGFFAISNVDALSEHWNKTQLGHLAADPVMEPFTKDFRRQLENRWSSIHERLGLTLEDLKGVPSGDVGIGLIAPEPGKAALAIVADVAGKLPNANEMLKKVTATQLQRGAKRSELNVKGCPDAVIQFDLPQLEEEKEAGASNLRGSAKSNVQKAAASGRAPETPAPRLAFYCLTGNLLVVADNLEVLKGILGRAMGNQNGSLAEHKPFQAVIQRCRADYGDAMPQIRWFIHPLGYAEAARAATPANRRRKGKTVLEVMRNQGVEALLGVGGFVDFASENYELVHRTAVYAPPPYKKAMKMAKLPNANDFTPQPWVPRDMATYTTLHFDILNAFDNFGFLFDELFGQGDKGVWDGETGILQSFKDPNGTNLDLREDLIKHLGQRISVLTDYQLPITTTSERLLIAIETTNPEAVAKAIEKMYKNDPSVKPRKVGENVIWAFVEDNSSTPEMPKITFGETPAVAPAHPFKKIRKEKEDDDEEEELKEHPVLPHGALTVCHGHLMIASHIDILLKIAATPKKPEPLSNEADYKLIVEELNKFDPQKKCLRAFSRTDEEYRPTYELVRQNKMPESESMLARLLNGLFGEGKKGGVRRQKIDGSQLPEYQVVRRYLGPAGLQATSEPTGWYVKGFMMSKDEKPATSEK